MKKKILFLTATLALTLSLSATTINIVLSDITVSIEQEKVYRKIETSDVPAEVLKSVGAKYSGYALDEAHVSDDGEYKLILSKDGKKVTAIYKANGEFVKEA